MTPLHTIALLLYDPSPAYRDSSCSHQPLLRRGVRKMADFSSIKLNPDTHLLLDQSLLRLPYELSRNNFKSAQRSIEQSQAKIDELIKTGSRNTNENDPTKTIATLDQAVQRLQTLKRKLSALNDSQSSLVEQSEARI